MTGRDDTSPTSPVDPSRQRTLKELFEEAEARIVRLTPTAAQEAMAAGALMVDIRSDVDRERDGVVPGALPIPRTVLEWRCDPDGEWRNPHIGATDQQIILICDHGYSSVLAAAVLVDLGFSGAGDVIGGFEAWCDDGLPTIAAPAPTRGPGEPAGMGPPDR